jgi:hypothetical protein
MTKESVLDLPEGLVSLQELSVKDRVRYFMQNLMPSMGNDVTKAYNHARAMEEHDQKRLAVLMKEGRIKV